MAIKDLSAKITELVSWRGLDPMALLSLKFRPDPQGCLQETGCDT